MCVHVLFTQNTLFQNVQSVLCGVYLYIYLCEDQVVEFLGRTFLESEDILASPQFRTDCQV